MGVAEGVTEGVTYHVFLRSYLCTSQKNTIVVIVCTEYDKQSVFMILNHIFIMTFALKILLVAKKVKTYVVLHHEDALKTLR